MRFLKYIKEDKWKRRQLRKGTPYWTYDKYEINKEKDGNFKVSDISQMKNNKPKVLGSYSTLDKAKKSISEEIKVPIEIGDVVLGGKFKNKRMIVKTIGKNEKGDITINGKPLLKFRIIQQEMEDKKI